MFVFAGTNIYNCCRLINSKPSGLNAGRKLANHRRNERWSSKKYNKSHSVSHMKANPLGGSCMSKGIVVEKMSVFAIFTGIVDFINVTSFLYLQWS